MEEFPDALAVRWKPIFPGESLVAYAQRLAVDLPIGTGTVLAGSSFGGMLALEVARHAASKPKSVVLIGSCTHPRAVSRLLRAVECLAAFLPDAVIEAGKGIGVQFVGRGKGIGATERGLLTAAAREMTIPFLRHAARAILEWSGCADPGVPVRHIHGSADWVILASRVRPDVVVPGGAHVLNLGSPRAVNAFLRGVVED